MSANENDHPSVPLTDLEASMEVDGGAKSIQISDSIPVDSVENKSEQSPKKPALSVSDLKTAYVCYLVNQRKELQGIAQQLLETVEQLKNLARKKPESLDNLVHLGEQVKDCNILLNEIKHKIEDEAGKDNLSLETCKHGEQKVKDADGVNNNLVKTEVVTLQIKTDFKEQDSTSDEELIDRKRQTELAFVNTIVKAAKLRQSMAEEDLRKESKVQEPVSDSSSNDPPAPESIQNFPSET